MICGVADVGACAFVGSGWDRIKWVENITSRRKGPRDTVYWDASIVP